MGASIIYLNTHEQEISTGMPWMELQWQIGSYQTKHRKGNILRTGKSTLAFQNILL
jgi:hypothetical protein